MPPIVATWLCLGFIAWLFRRDFRERGNVTSALWLPFFWIFISGSRFTSEWLAVFGINLGTVNVAEGSPIDALIFAILIGGGLYVLARRRVTLAEFVRENRWLTIYLLFCLVACSWSDYPFVAVKRWTKLFGQPVMALIVLTEPDPMEAVVRLFKRFAYIILPVSMLFIKYYPSLGRGFDGWSGQAVDCGITTNKNQLGFDCFAISLILIWHLLQVWRWEKGPPRRNELLLCLGLLGMSLWNLYRAHSSTSEGGLMVGVFMVLFLGLKILNRRRVGTYLLGLLALLVLAQLTFDINKVVIEALGRNTTLTGRTEIWQVLLSWDLNPILGVGYESFWLGDRETRVNSFFPGLILNEAHNGYLETYINLGLLGLAILGAMVLAIYSKCRRAFLGDFQFGRLRLAYLIAFLVYNWTEAVFRTHSVQFFVFFLIAVDYHSRSLLSPTSAGEGEPEPAPDPSFAASVMHAPEASMVGDVSENLAGELGA